MVGTHTDDIISVIICTNHHLVIVNITSFSKCGIITNHSRQLGIILIFPFLFLLLIAFIVSIICYFVSWWWYGVPFQFRLWCQYLFQFCCCCQLCDVPSLVVDTWQLLIQLCKKNCLLSFPCGWWVWLCRLIASSSSNTSLFLLATTNHNHDGFLHYMYWYRYMTDTSSFHFSFHMMIGVVHQFG